MASQLGTKYACFNCFTRFYDLNKPVPLCPKCGVDQRDQPPEMKSERRRRAVIEEVEDVESESEDEEGEEE